MTSCFEGDVVVRKLFYEISLSGDQTRSWMSGSKGGGYRIIF